MAVPASPRSVVRTSEARRRDRGALGCGTKLVIARGRGARLVATGSRAGSPLILTVDQLIS
jgi:hypothetical protein